MLVLHVPIMQCNLVLGEVLLHLLHAPLHHGDQLALLHQAAPLPDLVLGSHLNTEQGLGATLQLMIIKSNPTHFLVPATADNTWGSHAGREGFYFVKVVKGSEVATLLLHLLPGNLHLTQLLKKISKGILW